MHNNSVNGKAFKIKTTHPGDYTVHPSIGIMHPLKKVRVEISVRDDLIAFNEHKFLVEVYQFDWKKSVEEFKDFLKITNQQPVFKKLLGIKLVEEKNILDNISFKPNKVKDYLEIASILFLASQLFLLCVKMFK